MTKKYIGNINNLEQIDKSKNYVGYYWMSDSSTPKKIEGNLENESPFTTIEEDANPYIVEANLYCDESKSFSISIKNTGEKPIVTQIMVSKDDEGDGTTIKIEDQDYIAHRLTGVKKVCFKQAWIAKPDFYCAGKKDETGKITNHGMQVLQPAWRAFVGFEPKK